MIKTSQRCYLMLLAEQEEALSAKAITDEISDAITDETGDAIESE